MANYYSTTNQQIKEATKIYVLEDLPDGKSLTTITATELANLYTITEPNSDSWDTSMADLDSKQDDATNDN